ncbi:MAG TPA: aldehyde dehydrogenase [Rhizobium sp.]|nr:aldehyde dehydrogenase [Rhizobium sp.]
MNVESFLKTMDYQTNSEDDRAARAWLAKRGAKFGHFINGAFTDPVEQDELTVIEPASGQELARISLAGSAEVDAAVSAARRAQKEWAALSGHGRALKLYALARSIQRNARLIAVIEALDNGKSIRETRDIDVPLAARHFYHHAGWAQLAETEFADHLPVGVIGQIIPWNFPFLMLAWKIAPALAMGNCVVLKPAEATPLTALLFAELCQGAGIPAGVVNILTGDGSTGELLVTHPGIDKIAFTGSTEVGKLIRRRTAGSGKSLTLELGGKSPFIVFDDADLDAAVEGVVDAIWFNQGQVCCAGSRLLLQEGIAGRFQAKLISRMAKLRVGPSLDKTIDMSAVIDATQLERIRNLVEEGVAAGAQLHQAPVTLPQQGFFYPPTLLCDVPVTARAATEEIFGPVAVSSTFRTVDEAIQLANHSRYGLSASIWSESVNQALEVAAAVDAGVVWINATNLLDAAVGFGGRKESGFGREGGREGCFDYLKPAAWASNAKRAEPKRPELAGVRPQLIDRTPKLFVGGNQVRPDGNYSAPVLSPDGTILGEVGVGNRKDIRNAVEAAVGAAGWTRKSAHNRAQILFYIAENLSNRSAEFVDRIREMTDVSAARARAEVDASLSRLFSYGAWADKFEGAVHLPPMRGVALALPEPLGVVGAICPPEAPLLGFISVVAPLIATGNRVVAVPSEHHPLAATDFYSVLETSDVPAGVLNIVTGNSLELASVLARHKAVDAIWAFGSARLSEDVETHAAGNLKRTFVDYGRQIDWFDRRAAEGALFLRRATELKNIWVPYGE